MNHKHFQTWIRQWLLGAIIGLALPGTLLAQAYGQGPYGSAAYGSGVIQIGPITLPNTGSTWASLIGGLAAIIAAIIIWRRSLSGHSSKGDPSN